LYILSSSKASIASPVGNDYYTYRYWEIALCNVTLIAQNQYMMIPNNFEHKKSTLFFSLFEELKDILEYYFIEGNEEELLRIAENGKDIYYNTLQHRANYVKDDIVFQHIPK
jgi:hypothetical protein